MKAQNPALPILIRECNGTMPRMTVRYNFGRENTVFCEELNDVQIRDKLQQLAVDQSYIEPKSASSSFIGR